jgi:hypothetical protein
MDNDTLKCMNCKSPVGASEGEFFAEVFLCKNCNTQAVHFWHRTEAELKHLLTISKEAIRLSLITGKFTFPEGPLGDVSKRDVLQEVLKMEEAREQHAKKNAHK